MSGPTEHASHSYPMRDTGLVARLIAQPEDNDGRSEWRWFWLENGDLVVGFFPRGDSFSDCEAAFTDDWQSANAVGSVTYHRPDFEPGLLEEMVQEERAAEPKVAPEDWSEIDRETWANS